MITSPLIKKVPREFFHKNKNYVIILLSEKKSICFYILNMFL
jgi:hypothetical protein